MAITLYEQFTGVHWERIADSAGTCLVLICLSAGLLDIFVEGNFQNSFFMLMVGLMVAFWEVPTFFVFLPQSAAVTEFATNTLKMNIPAARAVVYLVLAFLFLHGSISCVIVGFVFLVCSILNVFAQVNFQSDLADGTNAAAAVPISEAAASEQELLDKKKQKSDKKKTGFGTF